MSGGVVALAVIADDAVHHAASAQELALPPLSSRPNLGSTLCANDERTVLAVLHGPQTRIPVKLSQVSPTLVTAVVDTEDHGFFVHSGFEITTMVRAAVTTPPAGHSKAGPPSPTTGQTALSPASKLSRKIKEAVLAYRLEHLQ